jgi:hypothetical protein
MARTRPAFFRHLAIYAMSKRKCAVPFLDRSSLNELSSSLEKGPIGPSGRRPPRLKLVDRINGLKIEIYSNEHCPPHFHVVFQNKTGSYRIKDCEEMEGNLTPYNRNIRKWFKKNKELLISTWNETRPANCPVGPYREMRGRNYPTSNADSSDGVASVGP